MCHEMFAKCAVCKTVTVGDLDASVHAMIHHDEGGEINDAQLAVVDEESAEENFVEEYYFRCGFCGEEHTETQMTVHFHQCAEIASFYSDMNTNNDDNVSGGGAGGQADCTENE